MAEARYLVGVDLGTVNSALAAVDLARDGDLADAVEPFAIPQLVAPGEVRERRLLPSCAYLPGPELAPEATRLPWGERPVVVGELAREQGARVPGRLVTSAKSWLANPRADRTAPILPWGAPEGVPRLSPVQASALYLGHLRDAWDHGHPGAPLAAQELVLAVPASFDEVARELTLSAARAAGLPRVVLVEEPSAAFHDWASRHRAALAAAGAGELAGEVRPIARGGIVLVVDVGGGTTDLTLVRAELQGGRPVFTRLAVGDHLLLGGDNVDLALARAVEARLGERLDASRFASLVHACRLAKERLMTEGGPEALPIAVVGRGSRLVASAVSAEVTREEVRRVFLDGFLPRTGAEERPRRAPRTAGLAELGLPYEPEPAIPRHVAAFLAAHAAEAGAKGGLARPDAILVNGGVFTPREARDRLAAIVSSWFPGAPPVTVLASPALDLAVARGAAYAALVRRGIGLRIGGGSPRAFYVGIAAPEGERALCVVPRHLEEGSRVAVPRPFALALGRPVRFPLFASARARLERPGDVVEVSDDLVPLPPVETVLRAEGSAAGEVPVRLEAALTEIGTLELWCAATDRDARWKLEFSLRALRQAEDEREGGASQARSEVGQAPRKLEEARAQVELFYGKRAAVEKKEVKGLPRALEKLLGPREAWSTPLVRELWAALHAGRARRRRSADHERVWLQLTGYCLRPGFGAPLDPWRAGETWSVWAEGLQYQADPRAWAAWWVMWRRIAGGLDAVAQERLFDAVAPFVRPRDPRKPPPKVAGVKPEAVDEMIRLLGALERVEPRRKVEAGEWLLARVEAEGPAPHLLWSVGRLGARVPFHASAHLAVPAETAAAWTARLLALPVPRRELVFPLAQLARRSGDRVRDVPEELRARVLAALAEGGAPAETSRAVREVAEATEEEEQRIFGESLPAGLRLVEAGASEEQAPGVT
ncbi:Hsp70 family protein [Anaeromyxobacter sp. SG66]|uniref:Hsp70 family protein n=1 Tax=Anaeromyxobacter sp. SG66 TaxID=2925410 RepID=UPI001F55EC9A|nr:Hsp70 family protein [Anaeromyxobacter sp. SG66]